jgi:hypothetical protein
VTIRLPFGAIAQGIRDAIAARRVRRLLASTPRTPLSELAEDTPGRVTGLVRPLAKRVLEAPLSGRLCVYYAITIDAVRAKRYKFLAAEQDAVAFVLDDGGHHAIVDPTAARISSAFDEVVRITADHPPTAGAAAILARHNLLDGNWRFFTEVRLREAILEIDERITILGAGTREPDGERAAEYRDGGATCLHLTGSPRFPLVISDDTRSL